MVRLPNGADQLRCQSSLPECLAQVDELCKGASYEVLYAKHERSVFGTDQSQVEGHSSVAEVHCLGPHAKPAAAVTVPRPENAPAATASGKPPLPAPACVPGATQTCVGPGACAGGQSCLPDGSGFGACDCGKT